MNTIQATNLILAHFNLSTRLNSDIELIAELNGVQTMEREGLTYRGAIADIWGER